MNIEFVLYILGEAVKSLANKVVEQLRTTLVNPLELAGNCILISDIYEFV